MSGYRRKLAEFFEAENRRDWDNYREFLHPTGRMGPGGRRHQRA